MIDIEYMKEQVESLAGVIARAKASGEDNELAVSIYEDVTARIDTFESLLDRVETLVVEEVQYGDTTALYGLLTELMKNEDNHKVFKEYLPK